MPKTKMAQLPLIQERDIRLQFTWERNTGWAFPGNP